MEEIEAFLAVIETRSQTAAARRLGRSVQAVNRSLLALEHGVGVELVRRTTRKSFATEAGLAFYRRVKPAFSEISEARLEAASRRAEPSAHARLQPVPGPGVKGLQPRHQRFREGRFPPRERGDSMPGMEPISLARKSIRSRTRAMPARSGTMSMFSGTDDGV
jgi:DNA-binding transcriptional LysR family regulator